VIGTIETPRERRSEVLELRIQQLQAIASSLVEVDGDSLGQRPVVRGVARADRICVARVLETFECELPDRLQHPEPRPETIILPADQTLTQEPRERFGVGSSDVFDGVDRGAAREDGKAAEGRLLL